MTQYDLKYILLEVILPSIQVNVIFCIDTVLFENRYISANVSETDQVEFMFASKLDGMYPVGLCLRILPGAFTYFDAGSWSGL